MIQRTHYRCSCGRTKTIIDNLLRNGNDHFQLPPDSVPCECGGRATPENVECPTCHDHGYVDIYDHCPDCTPENVEEPT